MASEPKHRKIKHSTHPVSSENEETAASEDEKSLSGETTSTEHEESSSEETTSSESEESSSDETTSTTSKFISRNCIS